MLENVAEETGLPNLSGSEAHPDASREQGVRNIASSILFVADFLKYLLGSVAVIMIIISGARLVFASDDVDQKITKEKNNILMASIGLIMIIVADQIVSEVLYGGSGFEGTTFQDMDTAIEYASRGAQHLEGFYNFMQFFVGATAMLVIIYNGMRLIIESYNQEALEARKKHIGYALVALVIVGLSELLIKDILFKTPPKPSTEIVSFDDPNAAPDQPAIDYQKAIVTIAHIVNFIASFVSYLAIAAVIYAGYLYVTARGEEDQVTKAKNVIWGALIGILLAAGAFAIVSTVIPLEGRAEDIVIPE